MNDKDYFLATYPHAVTEVTKGIVATRKYIAATFPDNCELRHETQRFVMEGGKRFRPALSYVVATNFGHDDIFPHLALETFHKYLLAHDDIIDRDDVRYGVPTVRAKMAEYCPHPADANHFGNALGIIAGNLLEAATHKIILESALSDSTKIALEKLVIHAIEEVTWGWHDQFMMDYQSLDDPKISFERIEKSIVWVTGKYSIKLPLYFGCIVAGHKIPVGLEDFADTVGALYQTGDDLIGLFGDPETTGKSNFGDITQGKKTLPMWLSYDKASKADKAILRECVGNRDCTPDQIAQVRAIVERSGGRAATEDLMQTYSEQCFRQLDKIEIPNDLRRFLRGFVEFLRTRDH